MKRPFLKRLAVGITVPALLILGLSWFQRGGHLLCPIYELTGLYCPGCGSGRAARALLRGDLGACLGHNLLALPLGLLCGGVLGWEYLRFVFLGLGLKKARLPGWTGSAVLAVLTVFTLLRNLPAFAFLAP